MCLPRRHPKMSVTLGIEVGKACDVGSCSRFLVVNFRRLFDVGFWTPIIKKNFFKMLLLHHYLTRRSVSETDQPERKSFWIFGRPYKGSVVASDFMIRLLIFPEIWMFEVLWQFYTAFSAILLSFATAFSSYLGDFSVILRRVHYYCRIAIVCW